MLKDPVELVALIIENDFPTAVVSRTPPQPRALSEDFYVYVQETGGGTSPLPDRQDNAQIDVVVYSQGGRSLATDRARQIQHSIRLAWHEQTDHGYGYIRNWSTVTKPYVQQLAGIPASTVRVSATYSIATRPPGL